MKLLYASDSFKGSLSSEQTVELLARAAKEVFGDSLDLPHDTAIVVAAFLAYYDTHKDATLDEIIYELDKHSKLNFKQRNPVTFLNLLYKAGVKVISAREMYRDACRTDYARKVEDAVVLLKDARQIFSTITAYEDSAQRVEECEKLIAEYTATADRFNKEKEKKDKRLQRGEVMKKVKIGGMIAFGLFCIGMYAFFNTTRYYSVIFFKFCSHSGKR